MLQRKIKFIRRVNNSIAQTIVIIIAQTIIRVIVTQNSEPEQEAQLTHHLHNLHNNLQQPLNSDLSINSDVYLNGHLELIHFSLLSSHRHIDIFVYHLDNHSSD